MHLFDNEVKEILDFYFLLSGEDVNMVFQFTIRLLLGTPTTTGLAVIAAKRLNTFGGDIVLTVVCVKDGRVPLTLRTNSSF